MLNCVITALNFCEYKAYKKQIVFTVFLQQTYVTNDTKHVRYVMQQLAEPSVHQHAYTNTSEV